MGVKYFRGSNIEYFVDFAGNRNIINKHMRTKSAKNEEELKDNIREFFERASLYQEYNFAISIKNTSISLYDMLEKLHWKLCDVIPNAITLYCGCKNKETTWYQINCSIEPPWGKVQYECTLCEKNEIRYFIFVDKGKYSFRKIGQYPPLHINVSRELGNILGDEDSALYEKALNCRNHSYGLGAVAYIRRVIENKVDLILVYLSKLKSAEGETSKAEKIEKIKDSRNAEEKLKLAADHLPKNLRPGNRNPLKLLYGSFSIGIHEKSDEECLEIFDETKNSFEYVLLGLEHQLSSAEDYLKTLQK